jgi:hypothetical protein
LLSVPLDVREEVCVVAILASKKAAKLLLKL